MKERRKDGRKKKKRRKEEDGKGGGEEQEEEEGERKQKRRGGEGRMTWKERKTWKEKSQDDKCASGLWSNLSRLQLETEDSQKRRSQGKKRTNCLNC